MCTNLQCGLRNTCQVANQDLQWPPSPVTGTCGQARNLCVNEASRELQVQAGALAVAVHDAQHPDGDAGCAVSDAEVIDIYMRFLELANTMTRIAPKMKALKSTVENAEIRRAEAHRNMVGGTVAGTHTN